jgi:hypothetical protein
MIFEEALQRLLCLVLVSVLDLKNFACKACVHVCAVLQFRESSTMRSGESEILLGLQGELSVQNHHADKGATDNRSSISAKLSIPFLF